MPIEFRCTQCQRLLRTPDDTAGKQAKCPACGTVLPIPAQSEPPVVPPPAAPGPYDTAGPRMEVPPPSSSTSANPYASPAGYETATGAYGMGTTHEIRPTRLDVGDVLSRAWTIFKAQLGPCLLVVNVAWILEGVVGQIGGQGVQLLSLMAPDQIALFGLAYSIQWLVSTVFSAWLRAGMALFLLKLGRGEHAEFTDLFRGGPFLLNIILASLLFFVGMFLIALPAIAATGITFAMMGEEHPAFIGVAAITGMLTLIPLAIYSLTFSQYQYLIVDQHLGPIEALSRSREIMVGNKLMYFVLSLVMSAIAVLGCAAFCVGGLFTIPLGTLMVVVAYLVMTGQPTYDERLNANGATYGGPTVS